MFPWGVGSGVVLVVGCFIGWSGSVWSGGWVGGIEVVFLSFEFLRKKTRGVLVAGTQKKNNGNILNTSKNSKNQTKNFDMKCQK